MEILPSAPGQLISGDLSSLWHVSLSVSSCYGSGFLRSEWSKRESKKESSMSFDESSMAYPQMSHIFHSHHILFIKSESVSLVHIKERELKSPPLKTRHILRIYGHIKTTKIGNKTFDRQLFFLLTRSWVSWRWFIYPLFPVPKPGWRVVQRKFDEADVFSILWSCVDYFCFHVGHWVCGSPYFDESLSSSRISVSLLM